MGSLINKSDSIYGWLVSGLSGLFMFLALFVYRAYHVDQVEAFTGDSLLFRAVVHSLIISLVFYIVEFYVSPRLSISQKTKPLISALIAIFLGLNFTFIAFNYFFHWTELYWISYLTFLYEYPLILVIPVTLSYLMASLIRLRRAKPNDLITFTSENGKEHFQLRLENLLYIKSAENYVEIVYQTIHDVNKRLIRKSLRNIEEELLLKGILVRCHRSYLVNTMNIDHIHQSNSKVELSLKGNTVPVSKKYAEHFKS